MRLVTLTNHYMEPWEGVQFFSEKEAKDYQKRIKKIGVSRIRKDVTPDWYKRMHPEDKRQTWTIVKVKKSLAYKKEEKNLNRKVKRILKKR